MKVCSKCLTEKKSDEFYKRDGKCKECRKAMVRAYRKDNADYYREYDKKRYKEDPKVKERHAKYIKTENGREAAKRAKKKYQEKNPVKRGVHIITGNAIRDGLITKAPCEECGDVEVHAHHDDYAKPLEVKWLCPACHRAWHDENGEGKNAQ